MLGSHLLSLSPLGSPLPLTSRSQRCCGPPTPLPTEGSPRVQGSRVFKGSRFHCIWPRKFSQQRVCFFYKYINVGFDKLDRGVVLITSSFMQIQILISVRGSVRLFHVSLRKDFSGSPHKSQRWGFLLIIGISKPQPFLTFSPVIPPCRCHERADRPPHRHHPLPHRPPPRLRGQARGTDYGIVLAMRPRHGFDFGGASSPAKSGNKILDGNAEM